MNKNSTTAINLVHAAVSAIRRASTVVHFWHAGRTTDSEVTASLTTAATARTVAIRAIASLTKIRPITPDVFLDVVAAKLTLADLATVRGYGKLGDDLVAAARAVLDGTDPGNAIGCWNNSTWDNQMDAASSTSIQRRGMFAGTAGWDAATGVAQGTTCNGTSWVVAPDGASITGRAWTLLLAAPPAQEDENAWEDVAEECGHCGWGPAAPEATEAVA